MMRGFAAGEIDVLVATTVVEVGVDVPERDRDGRAGRRPLRHLPAAPAARPGRPGIGRRVSACSSPTRPRARRPASGWTRSRPQWTVSRWPRSTWSSAARDDVLGEAQSGRSSFKLLSLIRDRDLITAARAEASDLVDADPDLADHPGLAAAVATLAESERSDYLEKT